MPTSNPTQIELITQVNNRYLPCNLKKNLTYNLKTMALQITETRGMFSVFGELNSANANILARHMQRFLSKPDPVILNLERVKKLDVTAAHMLREMYYSAMRNNSILSIVGLSNSNILGVLQKTKTSFIFSDDRI